VRKRRVELFFILYLTAMAAFVIVSRQRDVVDRSADERSRRMVASFIRPADIHFDRERVSHYVDADSTGRVARASREFTTSVTVDDVSPEDTVTMTLVAIARDNALISPSVVTVGGRRGEGDLRDNRVSFPVRCYFEQTGSYALTFEARTRRVHAHSDSLLRYHRVLFAAELISDTLLERLETATATLTVDVEDTSYVVQRDWMRMRVESRAQDLLVAAGTPVRTLFSVGHTFPAPSARVVRGGGAIVPVTRSTTMTEFAWTGTATRGTDTVTVEFRAERSGRVLQVVQSSFAVTGVEPVLVEAVPEVVYAGEELSCSVAVAGLADAAAYSWELLEASGTRDIARKDSGTGPRVAYLIPNNFAGKTLRIRARYRGLLYPRISPTSFERGESVFTLRVLEPPTHLRFDPPAHPVLLTSFPFTAYRYNTPQTKNWHPVGSANDVKVVVQMFDPKKPPQDIEFLPIVVTMKEPGRFVFTIRHEFVAIKNPVRVLVTIRAFESEIERDFMLYND
jgi:hypothetical protein